jgi:hypothetical protein
MSEPSIFELDPKEFLRKKISYYQSKIKSYKDLIRQAEEAITTLESRPIIPIEGETKQLQIIAEDLDFSTTYWKPKVFNFLFDNPTSFTTDQILSGIDVTKAYQQNTQTRNKAIQGISQSLFQLCKSDKVQKEDNKGRRGNKYSIKINP